MSQWLVTLLVIVVTAVALSAAGSPPVTARAKRLWMASILAFGCLAIAGTVWQGQKEGDENTASAGTTISPQVRHEERNGMAESDLARQVSALQGRVKELEVGRQARTITPKTADDLAAYLKQFGSRRVLVSCIPDDSEAYQYANQLVNTLRAANWDVQGPQLTKVFGDIRAQVINVYVSSDNRSDTTKIMFDGFAKFNVAYQSRVTPSGAIPDNETVELFIGKQRSAEVNAGAD
jgi:hypothetical protein